MFSVTFFKCLLDSNIYLNSRIKYLKNIFQSQVQWNQNPSTPSVNVVYPQAQNVISPSTYPSATYSFTADFRAPNQSDPLITASSTFKPLIQNQKPNNYGLFQQKQNFGQKSINQQKRPPSKYETPKTYESPPKIYDASPKLYESQSKLYESSPKLYEAQKLYETPKLYEQKDENMGSYTILNHQGQLHQHEYAYGCGAVSGKVQVSYL